MTMVAAALAADARAGIGPAGWVVDPSHRPIFHPPASTAPGYVGDANGLMFRGGLFHLFWQAVPWPGAGLWWGHAVSSDFVRWRGLPLAFGPGAESGGAAQLADGGVVTIFNRIGHGHWSASPVDPADPNLTEWAFGGPVAGIGGTDLNGAFMDGSGDGHWRVLADGHEFGGPNASANLYRTTEGPAGRNLPPPPPLRKHAESQQNDGNTGSCA